MSPTPASELSKDLIPRRLVYGGSFDPPHAGHVECVRLARTKLPKAEILVVPAFAPPDADKAPGTVKQVVLGFKERVQLCEIAFADMPKVTVSTLESELPSPSFTVETLRALAKQKSERLGLLIGEDQLRSLPRWREPAAIAELATFVVVPRPVPGASIESAVADLEKALGRKPAIMLLGRAASPAASHMIRQRFAAGAPVPSGWLPPPVIAAIKQNNWYGQSQPELPEDDDDTD